MEYYFLRYGDLELQRRMVSDRARTDAFARAIAEVVRDQARVLDVGTGTGILAMLAARAGASQVHGIDASDVVQTAANLIKANQLSDRVTVLRGNAQELSLDHRVDVLISEWLGNFGFVENMLDDVIAAREANLKEGGAMLPAGVSLHIAPLDDPYLYFRDGPGFWRRPVHGLDLSSLEQRELGQGRAIQTRIEPSGLLGPAQTLLELSLSTAQPDDPYGTRVLDILIERDGVLNGFAGWFEAQLSPSVLLSTSPFEPETHWSQTWLPFPPQPVREGDVFSLSVSMARDEEESRHLALRLEIEGIKQNYVLE